MSVDTVETFHYCGHKVEIYCDGFGLSFDSDKSTSAFNFYSHAVYDNQNENLIVKIGAGFTSHEDCKRSAIDFIWFME